MYCNIFSGNQVSKEKTEYDPLLDPTITELDLNMYQGPNSENYYTEQSKNYMNQEVTDSVTANNPLKTLKQSQNTLVGEISKTVPTFLNHVQTDFEDRMKKFEPLLDVTETLTEDSEITIEQLDAISERLDEIHGKSYGHDINILKENTPSKSLKEVLSDMKDINFDQPTPIIKDLNQRISVTTETESIEMQEKVKENVTNISERQVDVLSQIPVTSIPLENVKQALDPAPVEKPKPKLLGRKPLAKDRPQSMVSTLLP